jgi:P4 family phage/plasmid primase-like protien
MVKTEIMPDALTGFYRVHNVGVGDLQHRINFQIEGGVTLDQSTEHPPTPFHRVTEIVELLGGDVVLLPIRRGIKYPEFEGWRNVTVESMRDSAYLGQLQQSNIGVLLGKASGGLCSIDLDNDEALESFLMLNPNLTGSLRTRGNRGANIWVRIIGEYPSLTKLKTAAGIEMGEWRADGGQTMIDGVHPEGVAYQRLINAKPSEIVFDQIVWPEDWILPWKPSAYAELVAEFGDPYSCSGNRLTLNQRFFVGKFATEHHVLFEPNENQFYYYNETNGLWEQKTGASIKNQFAVDLKSAADALGEKSMVYKITDPLTSQLKSSLMGFVERRDVFEKKRGLIHLQNGMLDLNSAEPKLQPFGPAFYSRNQVPITWDADAECPRFLDQLIRPVLDQDDISLFQRWCGSALLGMNDPQRLMILCGEAGTGKSTLAEIVELILGEQNVATLRTKHLGERFELMGFLGKTLLTGKDVAGNFLNTEGAHTIKALCGGDLMEAEQKNGGRFPIRGNFNILITSNSRLWLKLDGDAGAWRRRLLIINFNRPRTCQTIGEYAKVLFRQEGPGILNWMIEGAKQLMAEMGQHGGYQLSEPQRARIERLVSESNSVREFVTNGVVAQERGRVTSERLLEAYTQYCQTRGWHALPAHTVERQMPDAMMEIHHAAKSNDLVTGTSNSQRGYRRFVVREEVGCAN